MNHGELSGYVTDGGLETDLIFHHGVDLPEFAAFPLVDDEHGREVLTRYYDGYADVAAKAGVGLTPRGADLAGQPRLGSHRRVRRRRARPGQPRGDRVPAWPPRALPRRARRDRRQGRRTARPARRRLHRR